MSFEKIWSDEVNSLCDEHLNKFEYVKQYLLTPGKRIRPNLFLDYVASQGKSSDSNDTLAVAIEILHLHFLTHDDILDDDEMRRDMRTIHSFYRGEFGYLKGSGIGIIVGDLLMSRALKLFAANLENKEATRMLFEIIDITLQGQLDEYLVTPDQFPTAAEMFGYYEEKTALYSIYLPLALGYYETQGEAVREDYLRKLRDFSRCLGVAFQINDDLIEFDLEKLRTEDHTCADVMRGKVTPMLIFILEKVDSGLRNLWMEEWNEGKLSKESHDKILEMGHQLGVIEYAQGLIDENSDKAWDLARELGIYDLNIMKTLQDLLKA